MRNIVLFNDYEEAKFGFQILLQHLNEDYPNWEYDYNIYSLRACIGEFEYYFIDRHYIDMFDITNKDVVITDIYFFDFIDMAIEYGGNLLEYHDLLKIRRK